ncbi:MAG: thioredoxin family protein [Pirellula sp.]|jgi:hypothetical protein
MNDFPILITTQAERRRSAYINEIHHYGTAMVAICLGIILLFSSGANLPKAGAQESSVSSAQSPTLTMNPEDSIRGTGDSLEFRLRGRLLFSPDQPLEQASVVVRMAESDQVHTATVSDDQYEVWLPAKSRSWFSITIECVSKDGRSGSSSFGPSGLRKAIYEGVDVTLQQATRSVRIKVKHNDEPVQNAMIKASLGGRSSEIICQSDENGDAILQLQASDNLYAFTAWTDSGLLGGYQFVRTPARDPKSNEHVIEMLEIQERRIQVVDVEGAPVAGVRLKLQVATPKDYNYFGQPTDCEVTTDADGTANYKWFPKLDKTHHYAELVEEKNWKLQSQRNTDDAVEIVVAPPAQRVRVDGQVSRSGLYSGGIVVQAYSFQGERENQVDASYAITDQEGKFSFDALPKSTYAIFVIDEQWVSEPQILIPIDPDSGAKNSPYLTAIDGTPVTIQLTSGLDRKPIAGQSVSVISEYRYSWKEDSEKRNGVTHRQVFVTTDEQGLATVFAPLGKLSADVYSSSWRSEEQIVVTAGKDNRVELHQARNEAKIVNGRIALPPSTSIDLKNVSITIQAIDGQFSEKVTPTVSESGEFSFDTKASVVGCFAYSADGEWAAAKLIDDLSKPIRIELLPTAYLTGTILDGDGMPIIDLAVTAEPTLKNPKFNSINYGFSMWMEGTAATTRTDATGHYTIGPLPRHTEIVVRCDSPNSSDRNQRENLGKYLIELDEQRPPRVHRLGEPSNPASKKLTTDQRIAELLRDARLGGFHAMIILADYADERCSRFVDQNFLDYDANVQVASFMELRLNTGEASIGKGREFAAKRNWKLPSAGGVVAVALDANGKELGQAEFYVAGEDVKKQAAAFLDKHQPALVDAQKKWDEAFSLAKNTNRRVWVRLSGRYCGPCFHLSRWIDDHRETLEKEFVMLKIDERDQNRLEIAKELTGGEPYGIPFFAFYSSDRSLLINSVGPTGNIGSITGFEGKRHFRRMLEKGNLNLTDEDIERLLKSIDD